MCVKHGRMVWRVEVGEWGVFFVLKIKHCYSVCVISCYIIGMRGHGTRRRREWECGRESVS